METKFKEQTVEIILNEMISDYRNVTTQETFDNMISDYAARLVKLLALHDVSNSEVAVCRCFTHWCGSRSIGNTCLVADFDCEERQTDC